MTKKNPDDFMRATTNGVCLVDGATHTIRRGETIMRRSDPIVKKYPHLFEELDRALPADAVEETSARPGSRRAKVAG